MRTPRVYNTEGIVLRQTRLGEADKLVCLYTPGMGKLRAVARGDYRPRSHSAPVRFQRRAIEIRRPNKLKIPVL
ncbi:MAG: recombination protein O N-terminal domain-containing protein [Chloroflexota bacterium]|nr:recombination protein O N-terminal domain-containing protein [Chloroflexota bacterium]